MSVTPVPAIRWLFDWRQGPSDRFLPRWLFLRALGLVYFSAFFSLAFQIRGLIGPGGILPAGKYLAQVGGLLAPWGRLWYAPTLVWFSSGPAMVAAICWAGMLASLLAAGNVWPRVTLLVCFVCFLSFVSAAQDFSEYQSDGMLLEAGFLSLFFAPPGVWPGLGRTRPPPRASLLLLNWEWFRIYFQSGAVKLLSRDPQWRNFTAMDEYYQNGPLPTWIGWYAQHLPQWFHRGTAFATLSMELGLVWMLFLPRRWRMALFFIVTLWQIPVTLTANYAFLNYIVLAMGVLLLDDRFLESVLPSKWKLKEFARSGRQMEGKENAGTWRTQFDKHWAAAELSASAVLLTWIFYATTAELVWMFAPRAPLPASPAAALEPFRIANQYGLFAVMTRGRYEIEFQGSSDGENWVAYPFRFKPQELDQPPGIYAPYQPRFDWNLWFASLGVWREYPIVPNTELRLLTNDDAVLALFARNPFPQQPPRQIRVLLWQYWFTSLAEKRRTGMWWRRQNLGLYAPTLERQANGAIVVKEWPTVPPRVE
ncbi:MAG: lipase maturation factor family protein [Acidobacteria bacterium]|nr:lipase maturation factor family protein [Acidobacteriota bacterium]